MAFYNRLWVIGKYLRSSEYLDKLSIEEQKKVLQEYDRYKNDLGLGSNATFSADAFDIYVQTADSRLNNFDLFKENKSIYDRLTSNDLNEDERSAARTLKQEFHDLAKSPALTEAQVKYKELAETFKNQLNEFSKPGAEVKNYTALIGAMKEIADEAVKAVETQHRLEEANLKAKFADPAFNQNIKTALDLTTDAELKAAQDSMLGCLKTAQSTELAALKKSTSDSMSTLHNALGLKQRDFLFVANLHKNNPYMRQELIEMGNRKREEAFKQAQDQRAQENRDRANQEPPLPPLPNLVPPATTVSINMGPKDMSLSGVSITEIPIIRSLTGKEIKHDLNNPGTFEIEMGATLWDWRYYQDPRQNIEVDMLTMAQAVRACGHDKITLNLDYDNPKEAEQRARQAYNAAIEAGFDHKNIVVKINGRELTVGKDPSGKQVDLVASELYKDRPRELSMLRNRSESIQQELNSLVTVTPSNESIKQARQAMEDLRQQARAQEPVPQPIAQAELEEEEVAIEEQEQEEVRPEIAVEQEEAQEEEADLNAENPYADLEPLLANLDEEVGVRLEPSLEQAEEPPVRIHSQEAVLPEPSESPVRIHLNANPDDDLRKAFEQASQRAQEQREEQEQIEEQIQTPSDDKPEQPEHQQAQTP